MGRPRLYNKERDKREIALVGFDLACEKQQLRILASFFQPNGSYPDAEMLHRRYRYMRLGHARTFGERLEQESRGRV